MRFFLHLLWRHLRQFPSRVALAVVVLIAASTLMLALAGAGAALKFRLGSYLTRLFPEERLQLEATRGGFGPLAVETRPITTDTLRQVATHPAVSRVWPVEPIRFPISVEGNLFGNEISSEAVIHGVERELVADALKPGQPWTIPTDALKGEYPLVVSNYFLDLYNLGLAPASGLPLLSPQAVIGRHVTLVLGESLVGIGQVSASSRTVRGVVVGLSRNPAMLGLALPAEVVRQFNQEFAPTVPTKFVRLVVQLKPGADRDRFLTAMQPLALRLAAGDVTAGQLKLAVRLGGWLLLSLAASVFILGLLTFYMHFALLFHSRRLDLLRLRALGATPRYAVLLALGEVGLQALVSIAAAVALNAAALLWLARALGPWLAQFTFLPPDLLRPNFPALIAVAVLIFAISLLPALAMLRPISHQSPAPALRDM